MKHAVGIVIHNRWNATKATLVSLLKTKQKYDLFLIDNGSEEKHVNKLQNFVRKNTFPIKQMFLINEVPMSQAFNLFLHQSKEYPFRTKMDNDVGIYHNDKRFLRRLASPIKKKNLGICSALPIAPHWVGKEHILKMFTEECEEKLDNAFLFAACMMISKECFDQIGYFNERLWRAIDINYCKRAKRARFKMGYAKDYWVVHLSERTELPDVARQRFIDAKKQPSSLYEKTKWSEIELPDTDLVDLRV